MEGVWRPVVEQLLKRGNRRCLTALGLWWTRQRRKSVLNRLSHLFDRELLESCYKELETRLRQEKQELCRIALLGWMDFVARAHGGMLYKQFRELLPKFLNLRELDDTISKCNNKKICNEPILCLKAYLLCKERWMEKELKSLGADTRYAEVARILLGEGRIPKECGEHPETCVVKC